MRNLIRIPDALKRRRSSRGSDVRFHSGPQGQPVPCFDEQCTSPHLTLEDTRLDAG